MKKNKTKQTLILLSVGLGSGLINGLFGAGSGLLLVPLIKLVTKLEDKKVHATTLSCVMLMCVVSSVVYFVNGQVDYGLTLWCLIGSLCGAIIGTFVLQKLKNKIISLMFSGVLVIAGVMMFLL